MSEAQRLRKWYEAIAAIGDEMAAVYGETPTVHRAAVETAAVETHAAWQRAVAGGDGKR